MKQVKPHSQQLKPPDFACMELLLTVVLRIGYLVDTKSNHLLHERCQVPLVARQEPKQPEVAAAAACVPHASTRRYRPCGCDVAPR
jgi:hypothetical protein